jgi:negative regulator of flagellin synthesis FlgM
MALKVTGSRGFDPLKLYSQTAGKANRADRQGEARPDQVSISNEGKVMHRAMQALSSIPDLREEKVQSVRQQVKAGTYEVSGKEIVRKVFSRAMRRGDLGGIRNTTDEDD